MLPAYLRLSRVTYIKELLCRRLMIDFIAANESSGTRNQMFNASIAIDLIPFDGKAFRYSNGVRTI